MKGRYLSLFVGIFLLLLIAFVIFGYIRILKLSNLPTTYPWLLSFQQKQQFNAQLSLIVPLIKYNPLFSYSYSDRDPRNTNSNINVTITRAKVSSIDDTTYTITLESDKIFTYLLNPRFLQEEKVVMMKKEISDTKSQLVPYLTKEELKLYSKPSDVLCVGDVITLRRSYSTSGAELLTQDAPSQIFITLRNRECTLK